MWRCRERERIARRRTREGADPLSLSHSHATTTTTGPLTTQGLGYTAEDSAGQSNIFAVEPKTYVAGSSKDPKAGAGSLVYAVTAGVIGAAAIAAGVSLTAQESSALCWFFFFPGEGGGAQDEWYAKGGRKTGRSQGAPRARAASSHQRPGPCGSSHTSSSLPRSSLLAIQPAHTENTGGDIVPLSTYVSKFGGAAAPAAAVAREAPAVADE